MSYTINQKKAIYNNFIEKFGEREFRASECYTHDRAGRHELERVTNGLAGIDTVTRWGMVTYRVIEDSIPSAAMDVINVVYYSPDGREILRRKDVARNKTRRIEIEHEGGNDAAVLAVTRAHLSPEIGTLLNFINATPRVEREKRTEKTRTVKIYKLNPEWIETLEREERENIQKKAAHAAQVAQKAAKAAEKAAAKAAALKAEADKLKAAA